MKHRNWRLSAGTPLFALLIVAACSEHDQTLGTRALSPDVSRIVTLSATQTVLLNDSVNVTSISSLASMSMSVGGVTTSFPVTWKSTAPSIASVSSKGMVLAKAVGSAKIIAAYSTLADTVPVSVVASITPVASVTITGTTSSISLAASTQLTAVPRDSTGAVVPGARMSWSSATPAIAAVTSSGLVSGTGVGKTVVTVTSGSASGTYAISVVAAAPPPSLPSGPIAAPAPPALYQPTYPTVTGKTWFVANGGNLQFALNQAQRGDEVVLAAGATFTGNFVLPAKSGTAANGWVLVRSDKSGGLPSTGTRVTPANAPLMPRLYTKTVAPVLQTAAGASGWWISGIEMTVDPALTYIHYGLLLLGDGSSAQNSLASVPTDLVIDRSYIHGTPQGQLVRCVALNSARTAIQDSYVQDCHVKGFDSQAIGGWNGPGPYRIVNNTLAGAGENIMFGGADPAIKNLIPSDIEIRRNYIYTPISWKGKFSKKNLFEVKNGQRILIEDNVFDGSWQDAQTGFAFILKVANQSGKCTWCFSGDITIRRNIIRNAGAGFGITGKDGSNAIGGLLNRLLIEQNYMEDINVGQYLGEARLISIMNNVQNVTVRRNTLISSGMLMQYLNSGTQLAATNFAFQDNIVTYGKYGFFSSWYGIGQGSMSTFQGTKIFQNIDMIGATKSGYPNGKFWGSLSTALASGNGVSPSAVASSTQGVIIP
ncbi:MAG: Ig-like domain-containing protein [Gemmatimonadaceae bacterium]|nr:Ig-like domain-containing protein [Gemmatimonadaceae bacterium]